MVYVAPPKGPRGGKGGAVKNGNKGNRGRGKEPDALASKADLLAKLTRQAEEHTRILERERAALGLPGRPSPNEQPSQQQQQQQQAANQRNRRSNYHVYIDHGNKKVFDPRQIPGLGGDGDGGGGRVAAPPAEGPDPEQTFNQTFPDSPNFYPGRVFAIPGTIPPPPNPPQQPRPDGGTIVVAPWGGPSQLQPSAAAGPGVLGGPAGGPQQGPGPWLRGQPSSPRARGPPMGPPSPGMGMPGGPRGGGPMAPPGQHPMGPGPGRGLPPGMGPPLGGRPPSGSYGGPPYGPGGGGGGGPPPMDVAADPRVAERLEAEARKEAYRRELEEQIRAKKQAKEAEERRRREEDAAWEARAAAAPQPWDPEARAGRRGGGGDPIRDEYGRPVANLRQRGGGPGSPMGMPPPGMGFPPPAAMAGPLHAPSGRLTIELPGGGALGGIIPLQPNGEGMLPSGHGHGGPLAPLPLGALQPPGQPPMSGGGLGGPFDGGAGPFDGPPAPIMSPGSIPPVSPGNRRFMAAMNDLIAGPSDEQRRQKEMARQRLQMDLEEQIREKRERQARERAELERQRLKEEAELRAAQEHSVAQRQAELARAAAAAAGRPLSSQQQQQPPLLQRRESSVGGGMDGARPPLPPRRHGRGGKIIDASWLDAPKVAPPPSALPPLSPQMSSPPSRFGRRASAGLADDELLGGGQAGALSPGPLIPRAPTHDGGYGGGGGSPGPGRGNVTTLLQQLQEEQSRMREDLARQASAMEKLANDASRAMADRDEAWKELQRVRATLAGGSSGGAAAAAGDALELSYVSGTVIVDTHLLPKTANAIPDPLPKPVASEVLRRGLTDPGPRAEGGDGGSPLSPLARAGGRGGAGGGFPPGGGGGGRGDGFGGGTYGGGFGYGKLGELQGPGLNRALNAARRSGIPLPPGMGGPRAGQPRIQSVYGYGFDSPPKSRYNSFFGGDHQADPGLQGQGRGGGGGALPLLGPRRPLPIKPPPSPAILRGDHLPSPVRQTRGQQQQQQQQAGGGARARSGRQLGGGGAAGGAAPLRGRAASAAPLQPQPRSPSSLPPVAPPPAASAGAATGIMPVGGQASRRNLEGMQVVLRRGHEERLLAGPLAAGSSDDGTGSTGTTVEYVAEEVPPTVRSYRSGRSREASLPGHAEMMSPRTAADYMGGTAGGLYIDASGAAAAAAAAAAAGKPATRSFYSDSMASYKSLLSHLSTVPPPAAEADAEAADGVGGDGGSSPAAAEAEAAAGRPPLSRGGLGTAGTVSSRERDLSNLRRGDSDATDAAASSAGRGLSSGGGGGGGTTGTGPSAGVRAGSALSAMSAIEYAVPEFPMQRPVRAGRRLNSQRSPPSAGGSTDNADGAAAAGASPAASSTVPDED